MNDNEKSPWGRPSNENEPPPPKKNSIASFIIIAATIALLVTVIAWFLATDLPEGAGFYLAYDFLLLALIGAALVGHVMSDPGQALRHIAGWVIIFGVLGLGYSIWNGSSRLGNELDPSRGSAGANAITFRADLSGHYYVQASVNGETIDFIVDTGATHVVLNRTDALKLGFEPDRLNFSVPASTANGIVYNAPVRLDQINVGPISVSGVEGYVNQGELGISLLGMSFLSELSGYEVRDDLLTLYP